MSGKRTELPTCNRTDCKANRIEEKTMRRYCVALISNDFGKRECPFYKKEEKKK